VFDELPFRCCHAWSVSPPHTPVNDFDVVSRANIPYN
jgi:hypothetical protein